MKKYLLWTVLGAAALVAQTIKLPVNLDALSQVATETVDVTLDGDMIRFAERFLSDNDPEQAKAKRILRGLKAIYVRQFEFSRAGAYNPSDLDSVRNQLQGPAWSRMVHVQGQGENTEVFARMAGTEMTGLVVLSAEPKELTIVHIDGAIRPEDLQSIGGIAGLPHFRTGGGRR